MITDNTRGAMFMTVSMFSFAVNDTLVKSLAGQVPLFQLIFVRGMITGAALGLLAWYVGALRWKIPKKDCGLIMVRIVSEIGAAYFFLTALFNMQLANATAILQTLPLTVTLAAALLFGEPLGWRRFLAIMIGFAGVLMIVQPGTDGFNAYSIYCLFAVIFVTARDLATRRLSRETPSILVTFVTALSVGIAFGIARIDQDWTPIAAQDWITILAAASAVLVAYLFSVLAMRVGDIAFVTPYRYTAILFTLILGFVVFNDWPNMLALIGAAVVTASGLFTFYRERQLREVP